jgi:ABC-type amino acid transport substrate-binding protein
LVQARSRTWVALIAILVAGCIPQPAQEAPTPTALPTSARPRFELATYMYALQTRSKIRIGVLDKDMPFAVHDSSGLRTGFEIDLGRELGKAIFGPQQDPTSVIDWISVDRTTAVSALTSAQADVTIARLAPPEGGAGPDMPVDLSDPYFVTGERILVKSSDDAIKDLPDLDTKTVCVQRDTTVGEHVIEASAFARTLSLDTYASCLGALREGQVDAIGADEAILWNLVKLDPNTKLVGRYVTTERYSIGVKKNAAGDRQGFLPFLNAWLAGAIRDGTWARLYAQDIKPYSGETKTTPTQ